MRKLFIALAFASGTGCAPVYLNPQGSASICADAPELHSAVVQAVDFWRSAGLPNLQPCAPGSVKVNVVDTISDDLLGETRADTASGTIFINVLRRVANSDKAATALAHEMGHALSLQHVSDTSSIMYPYGLTSLTAPGDVDKALAESLLK